MKQHLLPLALVGSLLLTVPRPGRAADSLPHAIDLKPFYVRVYSDPAGADSKFQGYAGRKTIDGLPFDINGQVEISGKENTARNVTYPDAVLGIPIDRQFDELHLVHVAEWREYNGCPVAILRLHYADGASTDLPILYNFHVIDWSCLYTEDAEVIDYPHTKIIWRGMGSVQGTGRLFKSMLRNPYPGKKVATMDVISTDSGCSYVLVAATVAQTDPKRPETPSLPLLPPRNFLGHLTVHVVDKKTGTPLAGAEVYPAMVVGNAGLVADTYLTPRDGTVVVNYPTGAETSTEADYPPGGAKDLRLKITKSGYADCEINWQKGWDAADVPEEITYHLSPDGDDTADVTAKPADNPALLHAVRQGDAVGLQKLIDAGADPNKTTFSGDPLIFAAGSPAVAESLLQHGADANARDKQGTPVLNRICCWEHTNPAGIAGVLLAHGADPNSPDALLGETPLMEAQDGATVDVLVAHGADIKAKRKDGSGILAGIGSQRSDYVDALIRHGIPFDPKTDGPTVMVHAAWLGNVRLIQAMLDRGIDPNLPGLWSMWQGKPDLMKPLTAAVVDGQLPAAELLLDHGAKADDEMLTALVNRRRDIITAFWTHGVRTISPLAYAVSQNEPAAELKKLLDAGSPADPPQDATMTPLAIAAQLGNMDAVQLLVTRGAEVNPKPAIDPKTKRHSITPLSMAATEGQDEIVSYLIDHGANPDAEALEEAAENSVPYRDQKPQVDFEKCVRQLLDAGALKGATPEEQGAVLSSAMTTRQGEPNSNVLKMLLDAGISPEVPMPDLAENGQKPNSIIGYYRDWYGKNQANPNVAASVARMKPMLDILEAADKSGPAPTSPPK